MATSNKIDYYTDMISVLSLAFPPRKTVAVAEKDIAAGSTSTVLLHTAQAAVDYDLAAKAASYAVNREMLSSGTRVLNPATMEFSDGTPLAEQQLRAPKKIATRRISFVGDPE